MVFLTRIEHFNAAHKLFNPAWSKEKNEEVFGKCANENWHGHNYELHVTVKGEVELDTGFVIDAKILSEIIKQYIMEELDHKNLNLDVEFLQGINVFCRKSCHRYMATINFPCCQRMLTMHSIKLYETPRIFVEYFGN